MLTLVSQSVQRKIEPQQIAPRIRLLGYPVDNQNQTTFDSLLILRPRGKRSFIIQVFFYSKTFNFYIISHNLRFKIVGIVYYRI